MIISHKNKSVRRPYVAWRASAALLAVLLLLLMLGAVRWERVKQSLHAVDETLFHEAFKDSIGRMVWHEDWARADALAVPGDYTWLERGPALIPVAHALGEITGEGNTLPALHRSIAAGFRFFEVDLWLEGGRVRCFHGPGDPPPLTAGSCTFDSLLAALPRDAWLVLDIKTDFVATGGRIVDSLRATGRADHVIFQLYRPDQLASFNRWRTMIPLAGPIVTIYTAHRSADAIAAQSARAGVRAFTLPLSRLAGFTHRPASLAIFVHPVDDCAALGRAREAGVRGVYMENNLPCADVPAISRPSGASHGDE